MVNISWVDKNNMDSVAVSDQQHLKMEEKSQVWA